MDTKLMIFDLDGTLLDTIGDLAACCDHVLAARGLPLHTYEEYCGFVGNGVMRLVERALPEELRTPETVAAVMRFSVSAPESRSNPIRRWCGRFSPIRMRNPERCCTPGIRASIWIRPGQPVSGRSV